MEPLYGVNSSSAISRTMTIIDVIFTDAKKHQTTVMLSVSKSVVNFISPCIGWRWDEDSNSKEVAEGPRVDEQIDRNMGREMEQSTKNDRGNVSWMVEVMLLNMVKN